MPGLDNLRLRLNYHGGTKADSRMILGKLKTLKKALLYSYQAETAILSDGREFRCLINTDNTKPDYDIKIISIPYEDICLGKIDKNGNEIINKPDGKTSQRVEKIGLKCGDVFKWKETGTYWLVYLEKLEENAYFRAEIQKCEEEITINNKLYHIYVRGPAETDIRWNQKQNLTWNDINYSLVIYITKNEDTLKFFHRFQEVKIGGKNWRVATVDSYSADGIIQVCLDEYFENELDKYYQEKQSLKEENKEDNKKCYIKGPTSVYPYETYEYTIQGLENGFWRLDDKGCKAIFKKKSNSSAIITIRTGKSGNINLEYITENNRVVLPIEIKSI